MKVMRNLVLLLAGLVLSVSAYADLVKVNFVRFNNTGEWQNGYPYWVTIQGSGLAPVMCDDYVHAGDPDFAWLANETDLGTGNLSLTRFGNVNGALTLYDEAGWLLLQTGSTGPNMWGDINSATWNIFDPSAPCGSGCQFWLAAAQNEANKGFPSIDFHLVGILTPSHDQGGNDPNGPQEFLFLVDGWPPNAINPSNGAQQLSGPGSTPEPGTWVLLGTGLVAVLRWKRIA